MLQLKQIRVKRRRSEVPAPTLVVRPTKRKRVDSLGSAVVEDFVFTLGETKASHEASATKDMILEREKGNKTFKISGEKSENGAGDEQKMDMLSEELRDMIRDYITQTTISAGVGGIDCDVETEDYVYDIYYSDINAVAGPAAEYIELSQEQERLFFAHLDEETSDTGDYDDADSNAEDFYANEYPEEPSSDDSLNSDLNGLEDEFGDLRVADEWSEASDTSAT